MDEALTLDLTVDPETLSNRAIELSAKKMRKMLLILKKQKNDLLALQPLMQESKSKCKFYDFLLNELIQKLFL